MDKRNKVIKIIKWMDSLVLNIVKNQKKDEVIRKLLIL